MKKIALAGLILVAVTLTLTPLSEARPHRPSHRPVVHTRVVIGFGPAVYWGPYPYPYWYYPPPPYAVYAPPPVIIQEAPPVYIQQTPPPAAAPSGEPYWYYCSGVNAYYPAVPSCPEAWIKVAPRPQ